MAESVIKYNKIYSKIHEFKYTNKIVINGFGNYGSGLLIGFQENNGGFIWAFRAQGTASVDASNVLGDFQKAVSLSNGNLTINSSKSFYGCLIASTSTELII